MLFFLCFIFNNKRRHISVEQVGINLPHYVVSSFRLSIDFISISFDFFFI